MAIRSKSRYQKFVNKVKKEIPAADIAVQDSPLFGLHLIVCLRTPVEDFHLAYTLDKQIMSHNSYADAMAHRARLDMRDHVGNYFIGRK